MTGTYRMEAIAPYCKAIETKVEIVEWRGHRVLVRDLEQSAKGSDYLIETDLGSVTLDVEGGAS